MKTALIVGIAGQDGAYLSGLLLAKGYIVHGLRRYDAVEDPAWLNALAERWPERLFLHYGDVLDTGALAFLVMRVRPDEIYNLAAMSHVHVSFDIPDYTAQVDGIGALRILEAIRVAGLAESARFYQASSSELFGASPPPQNENTPFHPRSPYAIAKQFAYWTTVNYREAYGVHASNGILFNHESPLRGEKFVTRKIARAAAEIVRGTREELRLGNLDAVRDWGHARDYVEGMWRMLQQDTPGDYVLATGYGHTVRQFATLAFAAAGISLAWRGSGVDEQGYDRQNGRVLIRVDEALFRPSEVHALIGDASKAAEILDWRPATSFKALVGEMVAAELGELPEGIYGRAA